MVLSKVAAASISRKLRSGYIRIIGVTGRRGFSQEEIRRQLMNRGRAEFDFVEFDVWDYSDSGDLVFTLLGSIADKAASRREMTQASIKKIFKVLTYVGASVLLKTYSGLSIGDIEKAFQKAEEGTGQPSLNLAEKARNELRRFFDEEAERKLVVLMTNLERADKPQIESVFNAVRYLNKASTRLLFVIFFDDTHESPETTPKLLRLCDSLIHLPQITYRALNEEILRGLSARNCPLTDEEIKNVEYFLSVVRDIRGLSPEAIDRAIRHFESSLEIIRRRTSARLYLFVLALKYQYPDAYRLIMEKRIVVYQAWLEKNPDGQELVESIGIADCFYYSDRRLTDPLVRLKQVINEGESAGL
jgi:hypothetical protein